MKAVPAMPAWQGWGPLLILPAGLVALPEGTPRWVVMWALAVAIYIGCKWLTWRRTPAPRAAVWRHAGYLLAWPGLDAGVFLRGETPVNRPRLTEWLFAGFKCVCGVFITLIISRIVPGSNPDWTGWAGMIGLMLCLHFGLFHLLSCFWRSRGIDARPLMNWPLISPSVSEFWGKRWNTAFRDLTHRFLFRPLTRRFGGMPALFVGFAFSGLVHDLVISVPAGGGFGGPTVFFLVQGLALVAERSWLGRSIGLGRGLIGWLFTAVVLVAPAGLLLHHAFVEDVVVPFLGAIGGVW